MRKPHSLVTLYRVRSPRSQVRIVGRLAYLLKRKQNHRIRSRVTARIIRTAVGTNIAATVLASSFNVVAPLWTGMMGQQPSVIYSHWSLSDFFGPKTIHLADLSIGLNIFFFSFTNVQVNV